MKNCIRGNYNVEDDSLQKNRFLLVVQCHAHESIKITKHKKFTSHLTTNLLHPPTTHSVSLPSISLIHSFHFTTNELYANASLPLMIYGIQF
jgi:hypothetical protein